MRKMSARLLPLLLAVSSSLGASPIQERADRFLSLANAGYQALTKVNQEAQWRAVTDVTPEHDAASEVAGKALAAFNGNPALIKEARELLTQKSELNELTVRQLKQLLLKCGGRADDQPRSRGQESGGGDKTGIHSEQLRV